MRQTVRQTVRQAVRQCFWCLMLAEGADRQGRSGGNRRLVLSPESLISKAHTE